MADGRELVSAGVSTQQALELEICPLKVRKCFELIQQLLDPKFGEPTVTANAENVTSIQDAKNCTTGVRLKWQIGTTSQRQQTQQQR